jgi:predicted HAD superfamily Cof-like phosphohydrolase
MLKQILQVKEFQDAFNVEMPMKPMMLPLEREKLRQRLLQEEVDELDRAFDLTDKADAIVDCMYILIGTALEHGIADRMEMLFDEVHRSNMSKMGEDGKALIREDGKILKPDTYSPPNLAKIMERDFSVYGQCKTAKEIAEMTRKESERKVEAKIKSKLGLFDRFIYWLNEKTEARLRKRVKVNWPITSSTAITVTVYEKDYIIRE